MTLIDDWRDAFKNLDGACPWPGPRPLSAERSGDELSRLVGRKREISAFLGKVSKNSLVILHADSGVGKSSLLENGLVPALEREEFQPFVCWNWTETVGRAGDLDELMGEVIRNSGRQVAGVDMTITSGRDLINQLETVYRDKVVFVLDQFEELIRYQPERFAETVRWILDINRDRQIRVVLSLRSEYLHRLKAIDTGARPYSMDRLDLEPITDAKRIAQIITGPNTDAAQVITPAAAERLTTLWSDLAETSSYRGLLHLQAALYALHHLATNDGRTCVDLQDIDALQSNAGSCQTLFETGLNEAIGLKLDRCIAACRDESILGRIDEVLIDGTHALVRLCARNLSSGGYKLVREEWNLAEEVLERELDMLAPENPGTARADREPRAEAERIYRTMARDLGQEGFDLLATPRAEIEAAIYPEAAPDAASLSAFARFGVNPAPWLSDRDDLSSGPMLGEDPRAVLIEEMRRFLFAVEWLETAALVRTTATTPGQTMLSLIHDGFSEAMERWVGRNRIGPDAALAMITAAEGERLDFSDGAPLTGWKDFTGSGTTALIVNMRWRNCDITAAFERVVFVNCDFSGSLFVECRFTGVVFVNCLLDGVTFEDCTIQGAVDAPPDLEGLTSDELRELPSFEIPAPAEIISLLNRYRGTAVDTQTLLSPTSGVPAVPYAGEAIEMREWRQQDGGLTMYGGRLSSLTVRRCRFVDDGEVSLRHVAGSSLDLVEQSEGSIELADSTVRGMSISRPIDAASDESKKLIVSLIGCVLADTWFGEGLYGKVHVEDSVVWNLTNLSVATDQFNVTIEDCLYHNVVNVTSTDDGSAQMTGIEQVGMTMPELMVKAGRGMSYRRYAAQYELARLLEASNTRLMVEEVGT